MRAAAARGHTQYVCEQHDVFLRNEIVKINAKKFSFSDSEVWSNVEHAEEVLPKDFDAIIMRKDPPFDNEYLYSTY